MNYRAQVETLESRQLLSAMIPQLSQDYLYQGGATPPDVFNIAVASESKTGKITGTFELDVFQTGGGYKVYDLNFKGSVNRHNRLTLVARDDAHRKIVLTGKAFPDGMTGKYSSKGQGIPRVNGARFDVIRAVLPS